MSPPARQAPITPLFQRDPQVADGPVADLHLAGGRFAVLLHRDLVIARLQGDLRGRGLRQAASVQGDCAPSGAVVSISVPEGARNATSGRSTSLEPTVTSRCSIW